MLEHSQRFRPHAGCVECDASGARVVGVPLFVKLERVGWRPRPTAEIEAALSAIYGAPIEASTKIRGLGEVAEALNGGGIARAQGATLLLKIPNPVGVNGEG